MTPSQSKALITQLKAKGWKQKGNVLHNPKEAEAMGLTSDKNTRKPQAKYQKTGWTDDTRNIAHKKDTSDTFIRLVKIELNLEVWPEFYFSTERNYRFDYAIPEHKIAIEQQGGIWAKGNSGHSSGKGIKRDMEKATLANVLGWTLLLRTPDQTLKHPGETIDLLKKAIADKGITRIPNVMNNLII